MYRKAISCWGRYLYIERGREKEKEKETKERERQERAKSAQLMQGRAKLATLGREVSILKKSHARTRFEKETGKGDICFSRKEVPTSPSSLTYTSLYSCSRQQPASEQREGPASIHRLPCLVLLVVMVCMSLIIIVS